MTAAAALLCLDATCWMNVNMFRLRNIIAFDLAQLTHPANRSTCPGDGTSPGPVATNRVHIAETPAVRRLLPLECERLQGLPDDWTAGHPDSVRYRLIGNGMAVPCVQWIATRLVEALR